MFDGLQYRNDYTPIIAVGWDIHELIQGPTGNSIQGRIRWMKSHGFE
jgi:hypothetical protein